MTFIWSPTSPDKVSRSVTKITSTLLNWYMKLPFSIFINYCPNYILCSFHTILPCRTCVSITLRLCFIVFHLEYPPGSFCLATFCSLEGQFKYYLPLLVFPEFILLLQITPFPGPPRTTFVHQGQLLLHFIRIVRVASWLHHTPKSGSVTSTDIHHKSKVSWCWHITVK